MKRTNLKYLETEGYTVKGVEKLEHSHGIFFQGNLYSRNIKIAEFIEFGRGAQMDICIINSDMYEDFVSFAKTIEDDNSSETEALLIEEMVNHYFTRKSVMASRKKRTHFFAIDEDGEKEFSIEKPYCEDTVLILKKSFGDNLLGIANEIYDIYPDGVDRVIRD